MRNFVLTVFLSLLYGILFAAEDDLRRVRSLSEQGLFPAAEAFCNEKLRQPDLADIDKISLATELVHAYSQQLLLIESAQRTRIIRRLESLEKEWLSLSAGSATPDLVLAKIMFRLQLAMTYHFLGDDQRREADTVSETNRQAAYREARSMLEEVLERLKKCQQELQDFRQKIGINADSSLQQRMLALDYSITMQQGIAQKSLALTFPAEADRNSELRQAVKTFSELTVMNSTDPVIVQCKIEKAACHRLSGELDRCAEILKPLYNTFDSLTPESRLRTEAEWIRYNIAAGNIAETRKHYAADRADVKLYPDFDLARLELLLTNDPARNIRPEIPAAMKLEQTIDQQLGAYWGKRARRTALSFGNMEFNSAEMLVMRAEKHYQEQQFAESAELYEQAAAKADANRQADTRDRYRRLAAHAWEKALEQLPPGETKTKYQKRLVALLRNWVSHHLEDSESFNLHLGAIDTQVEIVLSQPEALDDYLALVAEHTKYWNDSPHLQRICRLSVILLERQGRRDEASAMLPLLDVEQLKTLPSEIQRIRVRQLDSEGKTQEAVNLLTTLLKQKREPATLQLFAEILTRQSDVKSLEYALKYWTELAENTEKNSEMWWAAREGILEVLVKSNRREAKKELETLRILYPDLGGNERTERLLKRFE